MQHNDTPELIEKYFDGDLAENDLALFRQRLANDPAFNAAFLAEKKIVDGIVAYGNQQLRGRLEAIHAEETARMKQPVAPPKGSGKIVDLMSRRWWLAAAVLALVLAIRWAFLGSLPNAEKLYAEYSVHDFSFTEMGANDDLLPRAEALLKANQFTEALPLLEVYLKDQPNAPQVSLAKGIALMETGKPEEARAIFDAVATATPVLAHEAAWLTALAYLKSGEIENCKKALERIPETSSFYKISQKLFSELK